MYKIYTGRHYGDMKLVAQVETFDELIQWLHAKYGNDPSIPPHYITNIKDGHGLIVCWHGLEVINGEREMTDYTSW